MGKAPNVSKHGNAGHGMQQPIVDYYSGTTLDSQDVILSVRNVLAAHDQM